MEYTKKPPPFVDRDVSRSTDELKNKSPYWSVDLTQVDPGELEINRLRVFSDELYYNWLSFSKKTIYKVTSPFGFKTFVIPNSENQKHIYFGHEVSSNHVLIVPDSGKVDGVIFPYSDFFILSIPVQGMPQIRTMAGIPNISDLAPQGAVAEPKPENLQHLLEILKDIDELADTDDIAKGYHAAVDSIKSALADCLAPMTERKDLPTKKNRARAAKIALKYIDDHINDSPTIADICEVAQVSERTLLYAFRDQMDTSPKEYLKARKMQMVRSDLLSGNAESVTDTATRWGFWHMSQFAADYKKAFGELPSETLKNALEQVD